MELMEAKPGLYGLWLTIKADASLRIGRLGTFTFQAGHYLYIGSARGPGGIAARVSNHLRRVSEKGRHWHIDWLRQIAVPTGVLWSDATTSSECRWATHLEPLGTPEQAGFGASDCGCKGHLLRLRAKSNFENVIRISRVALLSEVYSCRFDQPAG